MGNNGNAPGTFGRPSPPRVPIGEITEYPSFVTEVQQRGEDRVLVITTIPHGKQMQFPFDNKSAEQIGKQLVAPSVEISTEMPGGTG